MRSATLGGVVAVTTLACSTADEILAWEETPDAGTSVMPGTHTEAGAPSAVCGNSVLEGDEACDDGNVASGDGCSATCTMEVAPNLCPGTVLPLSGSGASKRTASVSGDTSERPLGFDSPSCGGGNGKDVVYAITSDVQGQARIRLDAAWDALVYVRTACADPKTELTCKNVPVGGGRTDIRLPVAKNETLYVVVDGVGGKSGPFQLDVEIGATSCGDGIAQYPEQCDDGNTKPGDGCDATCQLETPSAAAGKCPGASYTLVGSPTGPTKISFGGDIGILANTMGAFGCGGGLGPDQVYAITPTIAGAITAELHASYADSLLHVRAECFSSATELDCKEGPLSSVPTRTTFPVEAQKTYFIFADTDTSASKMAAGSGLYTLDVTLTAATCGNGVIETPEQCDDGNTNDGDGCSATCSLEPPPAGLDSCPGAPITLVPAAGGAMTFATTASTASLTPGVKSCGGTGKNDAVYTFVAPFDGWLTARAKASFNVVLDLRTNCELESVSGTTGSVACGNDHGGDDDEIVNAPIVGGTTYWVVVDAATANTNKEGVYSLSLAMKPSVCGNGIIEGGEACDDGANAPGDGCDPSCKLEPPPATRVSCTTAEDIPLVEGAPGKYAAAVSGGNWNLQASGAFAAPCGATAGKEAYYTVTPPISGVLVANVDATYDITPGVRLSCPHSGTGFLTCSNRSQGPGGERLAFAVTAGTKYWIILDSPNAKANGSYSMTLSLESASCGDGVVSGAEQCDDGNLASGDGCSPTCQIEPLVGIDTCPGHAVSLTGVGSATRQTQVTVSTATLASNYGGTCGGSDRDGVVAVTSDIGGTLVAQLTSTWPAVFYSRSTCTDSSTETKCSKADPAKPSDTLREISIPVTANTPVYLFIDGLAGASGPANLSLTVTP